MELGYNRKLIYGLLRSNAGPVSALPLFLVIIKDKSSICGHLKLYKEEALKVARLKLHTTAAWDKGGHESGSFRFYGLRSKFSAI